MWTKVARREVSLPRTATFGIDNRIDGSRAVQCEYVGHISVRAARGSGDEQASHRRIDSIGWRLGCGTALLRLRRLLALATQTKLDILQGLTKPDILRDVMLILHFLSKLLLPNLSAIAKINMFKSI